MDNIRLDYKTGQIITLICIEKSVVFGTPGFKRSGVVRKRRKTSNCEITWRKTKPFKPALNRKLVKRDVDNPLILKQTQKKPKCSADFM